MSKNNTKTKEGLYPVYTFAIFSSMLLWLFPIGLVMGFIDGFTPLHIAVTLSGIAHFFIALYMLCKNTLLNNVLQIFLNIFCSTIIIYFARSNLLIKSFTSFSTFAISIETVVIFCLLIMIVFMIMKRNNKA